MGISNAGSANTEPFGPGGGADWLFDEGKVDPTTGRFTDDSYYPAAFFTNTETVEPESWDDQTRTSGLGTANPDGSVYSSGEPPAIDAEVSTIAQENNETGEPEPWFDQTGTSGRGTFNPEVSTIAHTNEGPVSEGEVPVYSTTRLKAGTACIECARLKQKCNGKFPCGRCITHRKNCQRQPAPPQQDRQQPAPLPPQRRTSCEACRAMKERCPKGDPCANCSQKRIACVYAYAARRRRDAEQ